MFSHLLSQFAIGVLGQVLPNQADLSAIMADLQKTMIYSILTGIFLGALLLTACYGFYLFLLVEGVSLAASLSITGGLLLLLTALCWLAARSYFARTARAKERLSVQSNPGQSSFIEQLALSFINGLSQPPDGPGDKKEVKQVHASFSDIPSQKNGLNEHITLVKR